MARFWTSGSALEASTLFLWQCWTCWWVGLVSMTMVAWQPMSTWPAWCSQCERCLAVSTSGDTGTRQTEMNYVRHRHDCSSVPMMSSLHRAFLLTCTTGYKLLQVCQNVLSQSDVQSSSAEAKRKMSVFFQLSWWYCYLNFPSFLHSNLKEFVSQFLLHTVGSQAVLSTLALGVDTVNRLYSSCHR